MSDVKRKRGEPTATAVPPSVATAWGIRERSGKGPKPTLTLARIVETGVAIAESEGLGAVSMSRVAIALGAATMSLYRYVATKDELLAHMIDAAFATPPEPAAPREGWRPALARWAESHYDILCRHRWIVRLPVSGPPLMPNQVLWFERGLGALSSTRLPEGEKISVLLLVNGYVRNEALLVADLEAAADAAGTSGIEAMTAYGELLARLVDADRFPAITAALEAGVFSQPTEGDGDFAFGLDRVLDGVAALVRQRR